MVNLKDSERQGEESGRYEVERKAEKRCKCESEIGEDDQAVMKRNGAFPSEATQECASFVFLIFWEGGEVENEKVGKSKSGEWQ